MNRAAHWDSERVILQYESLWREDGSPNLHDFLRTLPVYPSADTIGELCRVDLEHRHRRRIPISLDVYLSDFPEAFESSESIQDFREFAAEMDSIRTASASATSQPPHESFQIEQCPSAGLPAGTQVDHYRIVRPIGSGAFSHVYEAADTTLGRNVALKFLRFPAEAKAPLRQRMLREAHTIAALDHPGIVPVYGIGNWRGFDYIASRLIHGQTLEQQLDQTSISPQRAAEIVRDIAMSLDHSHELGIVHRDIKPANIMMESNRPLLVDFGLAHFETQQTQLTMAGDVIGTPAYMAPEQAQGRSFMADGRSDLYSLGVLLYRMLCGQLPFQGTPTEIISQVIHHDPVAPGRIAQGIGRDLETIVMKCMEKEPSARYATARMLAGDLQRYLDGIPILARRTGVLGQLARWIRRRPAAAASLFVAGLVLAALGGAVSQLQTVRRERDRAMTAEAEANRARSETRLLLSQTAASAGQLAMQRGRWQAALNHFNQAMSERPDADVRQIAWHRLSTLISLRRIAQARDVLDEIAAMNEDEDDENQAIHLYWQAELEVESDPAGGKCERLFEQAIELGIAPANRHYASGMLATHTEQAAQQFRLALSHDPFHHRARRELVLLLIALAQFDKAMDEAQIAAQMFPEDPDFRLFQSLVFALQGDLEDANACLPHHGLQPDEIEDWKVALQFIHNIPRTLQVFPDSRGFDSSQLTKASHRLNSEVLPLFARRGWVFPPRIARLFNDLPDLLSTFAIGNAEVAAAETDDRLTRLLGNLSEIHPEATLLMLSSYVDFLNLKIGEQDLKNLTEEQIVGLERMRDNYKKCLERRFLLDYDREEVWRAIYLSSMLLAEYAHYDIERNRAEFIEAARHIQPSDSTPLAHLRAYVITLLNAGAIDEAQRWAEQWVHTTNRKNFDALWHLMIVAQRQKDWLKLERLGREGREQFPDKPEIISFHQSALHKLREVLAESAENESAENEAGDNRAASKDQEKKDPSDR